MKNSKGKIEKPVGDEETISDVAPIISEDAADQKNTNTTPKKQSQTSNMLTTAPITFTLSVDEDDYVVKANAKINNPELHALLQIFFAHYPGLGPDILVFSTDSPFEPFVQHWRDLQLLARHQEGQDAVQEFRQRLQRFKELSGRFAVWPQRVCDFANSVDGIERASGNLTLLLDLIQEALRGRPGEQSLSRLLEDFSSISQEVINFDNLWTIYKPGDIVISRVFFKEPQAFIVHESLESGMQRDVLRPYWRLVCWSYDWTGKSFRRVPVELRIELFKGTRAVQSLSVYPAKYLSETDKDKMEQRGRRFRDICLKAKGSRLFQYTYSGEAIVRASGIGKVHLVSSLGQHISKYIRTQLLRSSSFTGSPLGDRVRTSYRPRLPLGHTDGEYASQSLPRTGFHKYSKCGSASTRPNFFL